MPNDTGFRVQVMGTLYPKPAGHASENCGGLSAAADRANSPYGVGGAAQVARETGVRSRLA